jgi:cytochrome d ubiquinol oxidase subunit II
MVAGWALAQKPRFLPGLTIEQAAASRSTLIAVIVAVACGALVLVPALVLLFRLFLLGRLDPAVPTATVLDPPRTAPKRKPRLLGAVAGGALLVGVLVTVVAGPGWVLAFGVVCLFAGAVATFTLAATEPDEQV